MVVDYIIKLNTVINQIIVRVKCLITATMDLHQCTMKDGW
jgi:hypothetical protein